VEKLEEKRVERGKYMIDKYGTVVIRRKFSVPDARNDTGNNNATTTNDNRNNNNDNNTNTDSTTRTTTSTNSWVRCRENRLTSNGNFSSINHQLATACLLEEVRGREQNNNRHSTTTTTTVTMTPVLCCAGIHCGMNNSPLTKKDFHKCKECHKRHHGFLCCVARTFDEHAGTGTCFSCDAVSRA